MASTKTAHNFAILQHARDDENYALKRWCQAAESLRACKVSVGYARKNGKKFTALSRNGRLRAKKRQKVYSYVKEKSRKSEIAAETLQRRKVSVGYARKNGRKFTAA
ncbi:hypothetical protein [Gardnerella sp. DNF00983]|uniref:hypothetical protein n=1 Tax=Gardnerella sp. DNF00983 TaxID=2749056 RepID=UPI003BA97A87